jgi:hypothetical protein
MKVILSVDPFRRTVIPGGFAAFMTMMHNTYMYVCVQLPTRGGGVGTTRTNDQSKTSTALQALQRWMPERALDGDSGLKHVEFVAQTVCIDRAHGRAIGCDKS